MAIVKVETLPEEGTWKVNDSFVVKRGEPTRNWTELKEWFELGGIPVDPSQDTLYDVFENIDPLLVALVKALNDGTFVPGSNYTKEQIKNGLKTYL